MTARQNLLVQRRHIQYRGWKTANNEPATVADITAVLLIEDTAWQAKALCREMDPELFFDDPDAPTSLGDARRACELCPVRNECLEWALSSFNSDEDRYGIFGGVGPRKRREMRLARRLEVAA